MHCEYLFIYKKKKRRASERWFVDKKASAEGPSVKALNVAGCEHLLSSLCYEQLDATLLRDANWYKCLSFFPEQ